MSPDIVPAEIALPIAGVLLGVWLVQEWRARR